MILLPGLMMLLACVLFGVGLRGLLGKEDSPQKTSTPVAIVTLVLSLLLVLFALFGVPYL